MTRIERIFTDFYWGLKLDFVNSVCLKTDFHSCTHWSECGFYEKFFVPFVRIFFVFSYVCFLFFEIIVSYQ